MNQQVFEQILKKTLSNYFGVLEQQDYLELRELLVCHVLKAGECLFDQGDEASSMYIVVSGHLSVKIKDNIGIESTINEVNKGECVGEMALITGNRRSASVYAFRDSVLFELDKTIFQNYIKNNTAVLLEFTKIIVKRLENKHNNNHSKSQSSIAFLPLNRSVALPEITDKISTYLGKKANANILCNNDLEQNFGFSYNATLTVEQQTLIAEHIYLLEQNNDFLLYETQPVFDDWSQTSILHADAIVLISDFYDNEILDKKNLLFLADLKEKVPDLPVYLVLFHQDGKVLPLKTKQHWLEKVPCTKHFHIRLDTTKDMDRLARSITGNAIGLACGGGGAKGFAHIGVFEALRESNIHVDYISGVSIGAIMGAGFAADWSKAKMLEVYTQSFVNQNILRDYRLPFISISGGKHAVAGIYENFDFQIEDLWLPFICHSSNLSQSNIAMHHEGSLAKAIIASFAIPGVLPPRVIDNNYLVDGGLVNNLPVDILYAEGCGKVIAMEVGSANEIYSKEEEVPNTFTIIKNKFLGKKMRYPTFMQVIDRSMMMASFKHTKEMLQQATLIFQAPVKKIGLTDWKRLDEVLLMGYAYAKEVLSEMSESEKRKFQ